MNEDNENSENHNLSAISSLSCLTFLDKPVETGEIHVPDVTPSMLKILLKPFSREFADKVYYSKYPREIKSPESLLISNDSGVSNGLSD